MMNTEIAVNSALMPKNFRREYDAHIYFTSTNQSRAKLLREKALQDFEGKPIFIGRLIDHPVGPHTLPMFEINFSKLELALARQWLQKNRNGLSVLIHEVTGDDPRDHREGAQWLGRPIILDYSKLDPAPEKSGSNAPQFTALY